MQHCHVLYRGSSSFKAMPGNPLPLHKLQHAAGAGLELPNFSINTFDRTKATCQGIKI